ncbi:MAG: hypothetical protein AAF806_24400 [Bacteroidota bacterium]
MKSTLHYSCSRVRIGFRYATLLFAGLLLFTACDHSKITFQEEDQHYIAEAADYELNLQANTIEILTNEGDKSSASTMTIVGAEQIAPTRAKNGNIVYEDAFEHIDLLFYDKEDGNVGYDLLLAAGADPTAIKMQVDEGAYLTEMGELAIPVDGGFIKHSKPYAYQEIEGEKIEVDSRFALAEGILSFEVDAYNPSYKLIIDPTITFEPLSISYVPSDAAVFAIQASCTDNVVDPNTAYLQISAATNATSYSWSQGSAYDPGAAIGDNTMTPISSFPVTLIGQGTIPNPTGSQDYTVRLFDSNDGNSFIDVPVTLEEQDCTVGCECTEMIYLNDVGTSAVHKFSVDAMSGISEIGSPWVSGINQPHGIGIDLNGFVFV